MQRLGAKAVEAAMLTTHWLYLIGLILMIHLSVFSLGIGLGNAASPFHGGRHDRTSPAREAPPATGPLRVHPENPRYFTDGSGRVIYLTGSHTWYTLVDGGTTDPPPRFDYTAYLEFLQEHNHNFIRLWSAETVQAGNSSSGNVRYRAPQPWVRSGPGVAQDGKPKFDLHEFNQAYFDRLRSRIVAALDRGIYVSIMLFEGHSIQFSSDRWAMHPFNAANNVNGLDGDPDTDGQGVEVHTLRVPAVTALQEAYVRKVIDTVNDLDNVLYEIANETGPYSTAWQYHMIQYINDYQRTKPKQHPVGMTFQYKGGLNSTLVESAADWISPGVAEEDYRFDPPVADGRKVILLDTDHLGGRWGNRLWVWKSFLRGYNPIYMDIYEHGDRPESHEIRRAMGETRFYAEGIDLAATRPQPELASTGYCLAHPGRQYLIYVPVGRTVSVDLSAAVGVFSVEWFNPGTGKVLAAPKVSGGAVREFTSPFTPGLKASLSAWYLKALRLLGKASDDRRAPDGDVILHLTAVREGV